MPIDAVRTRPGPWANCLPDAVGWKCSGVCVCVWGGWDVSVHPDMMWATRWARIDRWGQALTSVGDVQVVEDRLLQIGIVSEAAQGHAEGRGGLPPRRPGQGPGELGQERGELAAHCGGWSTG